MATVTTLPSPDTTCRATPSHAGAGHLRAHHWWCYLRRYSGCGCDPTAVDRRSAA